MGRKMINSTTKSKHINNQMKSYPEVQVMGAAFVTEQYDPAGHCVHEAAPPVE
jgi:hypothetical protein